MGEHKYTVENFRLYEGMHIIEAVDWLKERGYLVAILPAHRYTTCGEGDDIDEWTVGDAALLVRNKDHDTTLVFYKDTISHHVQTHPDGRVTAWLGARENDGG